MRLPNVSAAELDIRKLENYCLNADHPLGRHKARVFHSALGLTNADAQWLRREILVNITTADAAELAKDRFGTRYRADFVLKRHERQAVVRTVWIVAESDVPRFVTCWVV